MFVPPNPYAYISYQVPLISRTMQPMASSLMFNTQISMSYLIVSISYIIMLYTSMSVHTVFIYIKTYSLVSVIHIHNHMYTYIHVSVSLMEFTIIYL